jgi:hypothetical protein
MHISQTWNIDQTRLLTRRELATGLADLKHRASSTWVR